MTAWGTWRRSTICFLASVLTADLIRVAETLTDRSSGAHYWIAPALVFALCLAMLCEPRRSDGDVR